MQTQHEDKQREKLDRQERNRTIGKKVLRSLGQPGGLQSVQVRQLWEDHYRVNVLVGADAVSAKVTHSYFLVADSAGNIVESTPKIRSQYSDPTEAAPKSATRAGL